MSSIEKKQQEIRLVLPKIIIAYYLHLELAMEKYQISEEDKQYLAQLLSGQSGAQALPEEKELPQVTPAAPPQPRPYRRAQRNSPLRQIVLLITGIAFYVLLIALSALIWGYWVYMRKGDIADTGNISVYIFFGAVFLSSCLVTALSRGGAIFPVLAMAIIANIISLVFAEAPEARLIDILLKLGLTVSVSIIGFILSKLLYMAGKSGKD
ncbi:MAG: hypothetical protein FWF04_02670 [Clostridiales bacterium]|nr:hypothetical protein [Clostridiales bacterium]